MYHLINQNAAAVAQAMASLGDQTTYLLLYEAFQSTDICTDTSFQRLYRRYWRMNVARLSKSFDVH